MPQASEPLSGEVALDLPIHQTFHYLIPLSLEGRTKLGIRVLVPFGKRRLTGYLLSYSDPPEGITLRHIEDVLDTEPLFQESLLMLFHFAANYLFTPIGEVIRSALPSGLNVESKLSVGLTETGVAARQSGLILGPKGALLDQVPLGIEVVASTLLKKVKKGRYFHLRDLARDGFLTLRNELSKPRTRMKKVSVYCIVKGVSLGRREALLKRAHKQRDLFAYIEKSRETTTEEIRDCFVTFRSALNGLLKKGLIDFYEKEVSSDPFFSPLRSQYDPPNATPQQEKVLSQILPGLRQGGFSPFLLHGVTGSGKTEVYIRLVEFAKKMGLQAIILIPEISLTPQFVKNFRMRIGDDLTVLHSRLTDRERYAQWKRIQHGEISVVIGARSALFAPFSRLGMIIVDEEHETSYKQERRFPYHARSLALMRGKIEDITVVLGSATPSIESYFSSQNGKWDYLSMSKRVSGRALPYVEIVDLRKASERRGGCLSPQLEQRLAETLERGEQSILFLNRRGYNASVQCTHCGHKFHCVHCSVSLTYHQSQGRLVCHYCGYSEWIPRQCPQCRSEEIEKIGLGTEKVQDVVASLFPEASIARMDRDTTAPKGALEEIVMSFGRGEIDILVGTQMLAKGHDFPGVTFVGVVMADMGLAIPDFRAEERCFQLLMQVSGRAGRGQQPGTVLIQTFSPNHPSLRFAQDHDYMGFYQYELAKRRMLGYPPFGFLIAIRFVGSEGVQTRNIARQLAASARNLLQSSTFPGVMILGPAPEAIERVKEKFRWQFLMKGTNRRILHALADCLMRDHIQTSMLGHVKILVDVDPL